MKLHLELVAVVGPDRVDAEWELPDDIVQE
jgi:hypothetical protein